MSIQTSVSVVVEKMTIPTYRPPEACELPMYSEFRQHQGSTGYAYPNRVTTEVERETLSDVEYEVIRLENDFIRLIILPALGGRIFEAYDKKNDYHFLYRHSRIKPVLVGSYGSWTSGGMEWNFPFHHRPSTFLPVDYHIETQADGTVICWLSEASISPGQYRIKGMVGVTLRPDASYFETQVRLANRTETEHPFMWWENAGVHVHSDYQLFFPQDVRFVHHHYDRHHATFPIHKGWYAVENHEEPHDISYHKNTIKGNSYFAGPSNYDFFGGYDHRKQCGIVHIGNHHVTPGKKMFQWGLEDLGDAWNGNLTDLDGEHAELMAGSYADDQPDFSWLAPFETKTFSQFWYPIRQIGTPVFANLDAAIAIDRETNKVRIVTTRERLNATLIVKCGDVLALETKVSIAPSECREFDANLSREKFSITFTTEDGKQLIAYSEDIPDVIRIPKDNPGLTTPHELTTAQEICIAGRHVEQYRDPLWHKNEYYQLALDRDPNFIPALIGMASWSYDHARFELGLTYLKRAEAVQNAYNPNPSDGTVSYMKGLCLFALARFDEAYDCFYKASWSHNVISYAMTFIAAIDGRRGDFVKMKQHAIRALKREADHSIAGSYAAIGCWKSGDVACAKASLGDILANDKLDHLARYVLTLIEGESLENYFTQLNSNPSQTCLDVAFDLVNAGLTKEAVTLLEGLKAHASPSTMALYSLAYLQESLDDVKAAVVNRKLASTIRVVDTYPYRLPEIEVLKSAVAADSQDANAANLLGSLLYDKRQHQQAATAWQSAIDAAPDFYMPYRNLAVAKYSYLNQREQALPLLMKAIALKPKDDTLVKEATYVMAKTGVAAKERLEFILTNRPDRLSDHLTWELANAYSNTLDFDKALETLASHEFVAAECCETYLTEAFTFACSAKGRLALIDGKLEDALAWFRKGQVIPANFRAGWWDMQALYYVRYYEAVILTKLGNTDEARKIIREIVAFIRSEYSPYMGPEVDYYIAMAYRLAGDDVTAVAYMGGKVVEWEAELESDVDRKPVVTALYWSYVDDAAKAHKASIYNALAYSKLFFGHTACAADLFRKSLSLDPDNMKAVFELKLLNELSPLC